jgi:LPXTG-motif cell wall-anchored protein
MSGSGPTPTQIVPAVLGASTVAALPQTGANSAVQYAVAAAAGLAVWAMVYVGMSKFGRN